MAVCPPAQQQTGLVHMHQLPGHSVAQALGQRLSSHVSCHRATDVTGLLRTQRQCRRLWQRRSRKTLQAQAHLSNGNTSVGLSGTQHLLGLELLRSWIVDAPTTFGSLQEWTCSTYSELQNWLTVQLVGCQLFSGCIALDPPHIPTTWFCNHRTLTTTSKLWLHTCWS